MTNVCILLAAIINEEFGDGVMSSTDCHVTVERISSHIDDDRVVITFNARWSPHVEQYMGPTDCHITVTTLAL